MMNRPGQPPQRPPNLGPTQGMSGSFRGPFPTAPYVMPPRNTMQQGFPGIPNTHRGLGQNTVLPSPNYLQQRGASYAFGGSLQQQQLQSQQQQAQQQQHPPTSIQHSHQQQSGTTSSSLPPHLTLSGTGAPSIANAQSTSSTSEGALDPNDFPALGSGSTGAGAGAANATSSPVTTLASSYASQAGTGLTPGGSSGAQGSGSTNGSSQQPRDFTPDDFPALGGQSQSQTTAQQQQHHQQQPPSSQQSQDATSHPPGLNGFTSEHHRQNALGTIQQSGPGQQTTVGQSQQPTPGLLNISSQRLPTKLNVQSQPQTQTQSSHLTTWSGQPATNSNQPSSAGASLPLGNFGNTTTQQQNGASSQNHLLGAPPGVHPPSSFQQQHTNVQYSTNNALTSGDAAAVVAAGSAGLPASTTTRTGQTVVPQTPAQQVLTSAADRWGLLSLLALIKNASADESILSIGTDLGTMGLDMQSQGNLYSTFITPWSDSSAAHAVEPEFQLPACYNVHPPPPGASKATTFSEETLFFMFYAHPRDALQEIAAQELFNRNWRFNKDLRLWLTKEQRSTKTLENGLGEVGTFTYWDPENWEKSRKEFTVMYSDLEDKSTPAFTGPTLQPTVVSAQQQQQIQAAQVQVQAQQPRAFGGLSMTAAAM